MEADQHSTKILLGHLLLLKIKSINPGKTGSENRYKGVRKCYFQNCFLQNKASFIPTHSSSFYYQYTWNCKVPLRSCHLHFQVQRGSSKEFVRFFCSPRLVVAHRLFKLDFIAWWCIWVWESDDDTTYCNFLYRL